jgi:hypothetical protein
MMSNYMDNYLNWLESTTPEERLGHTRTEQTRPRPYDGPEGRARLTGSLDTGGSLTGNDDDDPGEGMDSPCCEHCDHDPGLCHTGACITCRYDLPDYDRQ